MLKRIFFWLRELLQALGMVYLTALLMAALFLLAANRDEAMLYELAGQQTDSLTLAGIRKTYKLDGSISEQLGQYAKDIFPFYCNESGCGFKKPDFRNSLYSRQPVWEMLVNALPHTVILAVCAMSFAIIVGVILGLIAAANAGKWWEKALLALAAGGMALPSFFAAVLISWLFGFYWHACTGLYPWGDLYSIDDITGEKYISLKNLILPALTLGMRPLAVVMQMTRNTCLDVQTMQFVRTGKAKGLSPMAIWLKYILRNALSPVFTAVTTWFGGMLAGAVFVEYVFGWEGLGRLMVDGLQRKDFPLIVGGVTLITAMFFILQWLTRAGQKWLDPRAE